MIVCPPAFQAGRRGFASRGLATRMILWREKRAGGASFVLTAASDGSRLFSTFPVQARGCRLLLESPLLVWAAVHEDDRSPVMEGRSTCCFGRWETSPLLPGAQAERLRKSRSSRLAAFSRPLSWCYPWSYRPALLRLFCSPNQEGGEGTDSEEVWMITDPSAILVICASLRVWDSFSLSKRHMFLLARYRLGSDSTSLVWSHPSGALRSALGMASPSRCRG
jgi:hypothetical protein